MKKMFIVAFIVAAAVGACGGKKSAPAQPEQPAAGSDMGSAAGSDQAPAEGAEAPAEGAGSAQ